MASPEGRGTTAGVKVAAPLGRRPPQEPGCTVGCSRLASVRGERELHGRDEEADRERSDAVDRCCDAALPGLAGDEVADDPDEHCRYEAGELLLAYVAEQQHRHARHGR